jgi:hypothetical protein
LMRTVVRVCVCGGGGAAELLQIRCIRLDAPYRQMFLLSETDADTSLRVLVFDREIVGTL